jgi:hypothetical protein
MERVTKGMLERKVGWLKALGITVSLDHHQPGGNTRTWAVESLDGGHRVGWSGRMTGRECLILLCGLIEGAEQMAGRAMRELSEGKVLKPLAGGPIRG